MKLIPLSQGKFSIIDDEDFDSISKYKWCVSKSGNYFYALRKNNGKRLFLHRQIMNNPIGKDIDHINHDTLDNRKSNLRIVSRSQNLQNKISLSNKYGYKGIYYDSDRNRWESCIVLHINGIRKRKIKITHSKEDAVIAYNELVKKYFGQFAFLNTIDFIL